METLDEFFPTSLVELKAERKQLETRLKTLDELSRVRLSQTKKVGIVHLASLRRAVQYVEAQEISAKERKDSLLSKYDSILSKFRNPSQKENGTKRKLAEEKTKYIKIVQDLSTEYEKERERWQEKRVTLLERQREETDLRRKKAKEIFEKEQLLATLFAKRSHELTVSQLQEFTEGVQRAAALGTAECDLKEVDDLVKAAAAVEKQKSIVLLRQQLKENTSSDSLYENMLKNNLSNHDKTLFELQHRDRLLHRRKKMLEEEEKELRKEQKEMKREEELEEKKEKALRKEQKEMRREGEVEEKKEEALRKEQKQMKREEELEEKEEEALRKEQKEMKREEELEENLSTSSTELNNESAKEEKNDRETVGLFSHIKKRRMSGESDTTADFESSFDDATPVGTPIKKENVPGFNVKTPQITMRKGAIDRSLSKLAQSAQQQGKQSIATRDFDLSDEEDDEDIDEEFLFDGTFHNEDDLDSVDGFDDVLHDDSSDDFSFST
eukprot:g750.t1